MRIHASCPPDVLDGDYKRSTSLAAYQQEILETIIPTYLEGTLLGKDKLEFNRISDQTFLG